MDFIMKQSTIELRKLQAEEGMVLTNGEIYSQVGGSIYLGVNDDPSNWREAPAEEYYKYLAIMEELAREGVDEEEII